MGLFGGKNSIFNQAARTVSNSVSNPTKTFNTAFGTKLPTTINIGGKQVGTGVGVDSLLSQARSSLRDIQKTGKQANVDWNNAGKGDVGKVVSDYYEGTYNFVTTIPRTVKGYATGTQDKENQKTLGSLLGSTFSAVGGNAGLSAIGNSSTAQKFLRSEGTKDWTFGYSENLAGAGSGYKSLTGGNISDDDRNNIYQGYVKQGVVALAAWGGASAFGGEAAVAPGAEGGAVVVESGTPYYAGGQVISADIAGTGVASGVGAGTTAAASATPWASYLSNAAIGYTLLTGKQAPTSIGDIFAGSPDQGGGGGGNYWDSNPYADVTGNGAGSYGGDGVVEAGVGGMNPIVLTGLIVGAYLLYRRFSK